MEKKRIGAINKDLIDKTEIYKDLTGISTVKLVEDLLTDFFKDKLLTNDFIELEKPLYFYRNGLVAKEYNNNKMKREINLLKAKRLITDKATPVKPSDIQEYFYSYVIKKVPNNLDVFNKKYGKYCYNNNPYLHKGIYLYKEMIILYHNNYEVKPSFLLFEYNEESNELTIEEETDITKIIFKIDLMNNEQKEIIQELEKEYLAVNEWSYKDLFEDHILELEYLPSLQVIENLFIKESNEKFSIHTVDKDSDIDLELHLIDYGIMSFEDMLEYFQL